MVTVLGTLIDSIQGLRQNLMTAGSPNTHPQEHVALSISGGQAQQCAITVAAAVASFSEKERAAPRLDNPTASPNNDAKARGPRALSKLGIGCYSSTARYLAGLKNPSEALDYRRTKADSPHSNSRAEFVATVCG